MRIVVKALDNITIAAVALFIASIAAGFVAWWRGGQVELPGIIALSAGTENGMPAMSFTPDWLGILVWSLVLGVLVTVVSTRTRGKAHTQGG